MASVEFKWSAQQFKSSDGIPFIGLSTGNTKTYIATGYSADGLTYGTLAGMIISDQINLALKISGRKPTMHQG